MGSTNWTWWMIKNKDTGSWEEKVLGGHGEAGEADEG